ncbi:unnamed protein product [Brassica rapa]|uniref:Uncharacterized protein n=1 Tax=Brassica campestris TaxID=3711 RepID=A0A8D9GXE1_BRACM|nr:unnamed protein product [Brassica rapa]
MEKRLRRQAGAQKPNRKSTKRSRFGREAEPSRVDYWFVFRLVSVLIIGLFVSGVENMPSQGRLSREEKGKAIATTPTPTKATTENGSPLDEFDLVHRRFVRNLSVGLKLARITARVIVGVVGATVVDTGETTKEVQRVVFLKHRAKFRGL